VRRLVVLLVLLAVLGVGTAAAATTWGGLTRPEAKAQAIRYTVRLYRTFKNPSPAQVAALERRLAETPARMARVHCGGRQAWRVKWPRSTALYVSRRHSAYACY